jgi:hypothetical protein
MAMSGAGEGPGLGTVAVPGTNGRIHFIHEPATDVGEAQLLGEVGPNLASLVPSIRVSVGGTTRTVGVATVQLPLEKPAN